MGVLMKCGHSANARDEQGNPVCVICLGVGTGATEVAPESPNLTGSKARCVCNCGKEPVGDTGVDGNRRVDMSEQVTKLVFENIAMKQCLLRIRLLITTDGELLSDGSVIDLIADAMSDLENEVDITKM
jgi:hypothetical protein